MTVSIAMCTYNGGHYLEQQLNSIGQQTVPPYELVICDDKSTDDTEEIVKRFRDSVSFPVVFRRNVETLGSTRNFEQAIGLCRGEVIALCDQDDVWSPEKLALMGEALRENAGLAAVFSNAGLIDDKGAAQPGDLWQRLGFTAERQDRFTRQTAFDQLMRRDTVTGATMLFRARYTPLLFPIPGEWVHDGWIALLLAGVAEIRPVAVRPMSYRLHSRQQVGAKTTAWSEHLSTKKHAASAFHAGQAIRFRLLLERLKRTDAMREGVYALDPALIDQVQRKVRFFETRASLLERSRLGRVVMAARLLPEYRLYEKGMLSMVRDLMH